MTRRQRRRRHAHSSARMAQPGEWLIDMHDVTRFDLASAYALIRAITCRREPPSVTIRGAPRMVQRAFRHTGLDEIATMT
ncbi:STAS domain-containing protein [Streptomyces sp. NPDC056437]|uniref:STAS domain-containing protein n=1 Tax=Streptomyces sp. NPDC056437 TaxID=3345816 RepID=UPI003698A980